MNNLTTLPLAYVAADFASRHIGPSPQEIQQMLEAVGVKTMDELVA